MNIKSTCMYIYIKHSAYTVEIDTPQNQLYFSKFKNSMIPLSQ